MRLLINTTFKPAFLASVNEGIKSSNCPTFGLPLSSIPTTTSEWLLKNSIANAVISSASRIGKLLFTDIIRREIIFNFCGLFLKIK